jgi:hypothetical protein
MFNLAPDKILESLHQKFGESDWEWHLGNSQTQPHLLGVIECQYSKMIVLLDRELEVPGHLIYAYGGCVRLFDNTRLGALGGHIPTHAAFTTHETGSNAWVYLSSDHDGLYYPMKLTHIAYGGNDCLIWHEFR